jgi:hypothetical protein
MTELDAIENLLQRHTRPAVSKQQLPVLAKPNMPVHEKGHGVKVSLAPDSSGITIKPTNLLESLKVQQYLDGMGQQWNDGPGELSLMYSLVRRESRTETWFSTI